MYNFSHLQVINDFICRRPDFDFFTEVLFFFFSQDLTSSARPHRHYASASPITSAQFPSRNRRAE